MKAFAIKNPKFNSTNRARSLTLQNRPRTLICFICGKHFGTSSLKFHIKSCYKKRSNPRYGPEKSIPEAPATYFHVINKDYLTREEIDFYNNEAYGVYIRYNLIECSRCGQYFEPEQMGVHEALCFKMNVGKFKKRKVGNFTIGRRKKGNWRQRTRKKKSDMNYNRTNLNMKQKEFENMLLNGLVKEYAKENMNRQMNNGPRYNPVHFPNDQNPPHSDFTIKHLGKISLKSNSTLKKPEIVDLEFEKQKPRGKWGKLRKEREKKVENFEGPDVEILEPGESVKVVKRGLLSQVSGVDSTVNQSVFENLDPEEVEKKKPKRKKAGKWQKKQKKRVSSKNSKKRPNSRKNPVRRRNSRKGVIKKKKMMEIPISEGMKIGAEEFFFENIGKVLLQNFKRNMVPCPHCGRKFNQYASEKHIPICAKANPLPPKKVKKRRRKKKSNLEEIRKNRENFGKKF